MTHRQIVIGGLIVTMLLLWQCCGCIPPFVQKDVESSGIAFGKIEKDERCPVDVRSLAEAGRKANEATLDKIGKCGETITPDNVGEKLKEVKREAEAYAPWWEQVTTGNGLFDILIVLLTGGAAWKGKNLFRGGLHLLSHNPKKGEVNGSSKEAIKS